MSYGMEGLPSVRQNVGRRPNGSYLCVGEGLALIFGKKNSFYCIYCKYCTQKPQETKKA